VLAHESRQSAGSLIFDVRQNMKSIRVTLNFSDDFAMLSGWHVCGQRYLSLLFRISKSTREADQVRLERLAKEFSLEGELCADLFHVGAYEKSTDLLISGYIFRDSEISPNLHRLASLTKNEVTEISNLLERTEGLLSYSATEEISKSERGSSEKLRIFKKKGA
jgi:hypothetical protein